MRYYTTAAFFERMRQIRSNQTIKMSSAVYLKGVYAQAAKYFCVTESQLTVIEEIGQTVGITVIDTVYIDPNEVADALV